MDIDNRVSDAIPKMVFKRCSRLLVGRGRAAHEYNDTRCFHRGDRYTLRRAEQEDDEP